MAACLILVQPASPRLQPVVLQKVAITSRAGPLTTPDPTTDGQIMEDQVREALRTAAAVALIIGFIILCAVAGRLCVKRNRTDAPLL